MTLAIDDCRYAGDRTFRIADAPTSAHMTKGDRARYSELTDENRVLVGELQDKLYADGKEGLVILLQAMDAAGKDSTIRHVMSGMNPQGIDVYGFKQPTRRELAHDYLWRAARCLPERGKIALFNRSYYEDVLVVRVAGLWHDYRMPGRCLDCTEDEFFSRRFGQIRDFEEHLYQNGYRVLKVFLNVGLDEQRKRLLARIDDEAKNWKFSASDLAEREHWDAYMAAYEDAINATATEHAPWYVVPADQKWHARYLVSQAVVNVLGDIDPRYPEVSAGEKDELAACKARLLGE